MRFCAKKCAISGLALSALLHRKSWTQAWRTQILSRAIVVIVISASSPSLRRAVGWVERLVRRSSTSEGGSDTHQCRCAWRWVSLALHPSYGPCRRNSACNEMARCAIAGWRCQTAPKGSTHDGTGRLILCLCRATLWTWRCGIRIRRIIPILPIFGPS